MGEPVDVELFAAACDGRGDFGRTARAFSDELRSARRCLAAAAEVLTHLGVEFDDARLDYLVAQVDKADLARWSAMISAHHARLGVGPGPAGAGGEAAGRSGSHMGSAITADPPPAATADESALPSQADVLGWVRRHYPSNTDPASRALKLGEEAGEVQGAVIKMAEGRKTIEDLRTELAQLVLCAMGLAESAGTGLWAAVASEWARALRAEHPAGGSSCGGTGGA